MVDIEITKIAKLSESIEKIEKEFLNFEENFKENKMGQEEFEGIKTNLFEEIRKINYGIKQIKDLLSTRSEKEQHIIRELNLLSEQFQTEIDEDTGIATVFLSASLDIHFEIDIDSSQYPEIPYLFVPKTMDTYLGSNFITNLKTLRKWSKKKPIHLVDIFKEIEEKLVEIFQKEEGVSEDREKLAKRRKFIELARNAEKAGDIEEAINLYQIILEISQDLKDRTSYFKFKKILEELKPNVEEQ